MARKITDYNGSVIAVGATYPFGDIKDAPSGTIVDRTSYADMHQFFQKLMFSAGITPNGLPDNVTNGWQLMQSLTRVMSAHVNGVLRQKLSITLDNTTVYILSGCETYENDGFVYYNGRIYFVKGTGGPVSCGGSDVKVLVENNDAYGNGLRQLDVQCGASGSGVANFTDLIPLGEWSPETSTVFTPSGGTATIDSGDIVYNRYYVDGNTVTWQLKVRNATFSAGVDDIEITPSFLTSSGKTIANFGAVLVGGLCLDGIMTATLTTTGVVIAPLSGSFSDGTNNRNFDLNITFEIE